MEFRFLRKHYNHHIRLDIRDESLLCKRGHLRYHLPERVGVASPNWIISVMKPSAVTRLPTPDNGKNYDTGAGPRNKGIGPRHSFKMAQECISLATTYSGHNVIRIHKERLYLPVIKAAHTSVKKPLAELQYTLLAINKIRSIHYICYSAMHTSQTC